MAYHHYNNEELQEIFETLTEMNDKGLVSGLGIFVSYNSSKFNYIKVGNLAEIPILEALQKKIKKDFSKYSAKASR